MADIRVKGHASLEAMTMDWVIRADGRMDECEELGTAIRVALGTDKLAAPFEILPDIDSTDRRGWWGDWDADTIWGGWPIGTKNWLLLRAKISDPVSYEGATVERARLYTLEALQPFVDRKIASAINVTAERVGLDRIDVEATIYRGPLQEIALRYQILWDEIKANYIGIPACEDERVIGLAHPVVLMPIQSSLTCNATYLNRKWQARATLPVTSIMRQNPPPRILGRQFAIAKLTPSFGIQANPFFPAGSIMLLHFDSTDMVGPGAFNDAKNRQFVESITEGPSPGVDTGNKKFGDGSCFFKINLDIHDPEALGVENPNGTNVDFAFGTGPFTVDCWIQPLFNNVNQKIYSGGPDAGPYLNLLLNSSNQLVVRINNINVCTSVATINLPTSFVHVAATRNGSTVRCFVNGNLEATGTDSTNIQLYNDNPVIGADYNAKDVYHGIAPPPVGYQYAGWMDEYRVMRSAAWIASFTPPTAPYAG